MLAAHMEEEELGMLSVFYFYNQRMVRNTPVHQEKWKRGSQTDIFPLKKHAIIQSALCQHNGRTSVLDRYRLTAKARKYPENISIYVFLKTIQHREMGCQYQTTKQPLPASILRTPFFF